MAFWRKVYRSVEEIQLDLDVWLGHYNNERTHSGKYCYGKRAYLIFCVNALVPSERHPFLSKLNGELV